MKHLVVLAGAGISAESGLSTFHYKGGLWTKVNVVISYKLSFSSIIFIFFIFAPKTKKVGEIFGGSG